MCVYLQWKGRNYRLNGMSPAFAIRHDEVLTLEGRDLLVTPLAGTPRRISLKQELPDSPHILNMQPTRDGVMLNVGGNYHVVKVNMVTATVQPVPRAFRVRGAEMTDRYVVNWSLDKPHQVRDGQDRVVRQHGRYPVHFGEWDADPVDDIFAISSKFKVTLLGADGFTMCDINPDMAIASITMQPGSHQVWIAEDARHLITADPPAESPACRLRMYDYAGRCLGQRMIQGEQVLSAMPVKEAIAQYLINRYAKGSAH